MKNNKEKYRTSSNTGIKHTQCSRLALPIYEHIAYLKSHSEVICLMFNKHARIQAPKWVIFPPQCRHLGMFIHFNITLSLIKTFLELLFWNCLQSLRNILLNIFRLLWLHKKKGGGSVFASDILSPFYCFKS